MYGGGGSGFLHHLRPHRFRIKFLLRGLIFPGNGSLQRFGRVLRLVLKLKSATGMAILNECSIGMKHLLSYYAVLSNVL